MGKSMKIIIFQKIVNFLMWGLPAGYIDQLMSVIFLHISKIPYELN